jgi:hypothetical protein
MVTWFLVVVLGLFMTVLCALLTAVRNIDVATVRDTREWRRRSNRGGRD